MDSLPLGINPNHFPAKLWRLVNSPDVCSIFWDRFGELVIINQPLFQEEILGAANADGFKTANFSSFIRQLNLYGFKKVRNVEVEHYYQFFFNQNFRRDRPELVAKLWRLTAENKAKVQAGGADGDPDVRRSPVPPRCLQSDQGEALRSFIAAHKLIPASINQLSPEAASSERESLACAAQGDLQIITFNLCDAQYYPNFYCPVSPSFHPNLAPGSEHQTWLISPHSCYQIKHIAFHRNNTHNALY